MAEEKRIIEEIEVYGGQDSDTAPERIANGNFLSALNIVNNSSGVGNKSVITLPKGNLEIEYDLPDGENLTIGTAADHENGKFYWFNWNEEGYHGIYQFNVVDRKIVCILLNLEDTGGIDILKFSKDYLILHANVLRKNLLTWVDGLNSARKTNIKKLLDKSGTGYGTTVLESFIDAYKHTSNYAPKAEYFSDTTKTFNRLYGSLRRFAQRFVYDDGEKSNWSDFSSIALPGKEPFTGIKTIPTDNNGLKITLETGNKTVVKIEIAMQSTSGEKNNEGILNWQLIATLNKSRLNISDNSEYVYKFYNDGDYPVTAYEKVIRPFIFLPRQPTGQAYAKGKLVYVGGKEGFDNVELDIDVSTQYVDLFIDNGTENAENVPGITVIAIVDSEDYLKINDRYTNLDGKEIKVTRSVQPTYISTAKRAIAYTVNILADVKAGNIFNISLFNSRHTFTYAYKAKAVDTARTVANAIKALLVLSGVIVRKTEDNPEYYIYTNEEDGFGNVTFRFIALAEYKDNYFRASASVEPVQFNTLKDTGESIRSQKLGSTQKFGLMYEAGQKSLTYTDDKLIVPIKTINELINVDGKTGMQSAVINLTLNHQPPKWATHYQIVRQNDLVYDDYIQMLVQKVVNVQGTTTEEYQDLIIGSLATYNKIHPNSNLQYESSKGDRIRLIQKIESGDYYDFFETEILDYLPVVTEKITANVKINGTTTITVKSASADNIGRFIVIDGVEREIISAPTSTTYEIDSAIGETTAKTYNNYQIIDRRGVVRIRKSTVVIEDLSLIEIYKPSNGGEADKQFFEFQKKFPIINAGLDNAYHGGNVQNQSDSLPAIVSITEGTAYVRNRELPITNAYPGAQVVIVPIEDSSFSDFYPSLINDNGRPSVEDIGAGELTLDDRFRFSNNSIEDTRINGLLDFDAQDYYDYHDQYGSTKRVFAEKNNIIVFKQLHNAYIPLDSKITTDDAGNALRVGSAKFLNPLQYMGMEIGVGNNPEAFCYHHTHKYIVCPRFGAVVRIGANGEELISKTFFLNRVAREVLHKADKNGAKVFIGFNPNLSYLYVTIKQYNEVIYEGGFNGWDTIGDEISAETLIEIVDQPLHGTVIINDDNQFEYTPNENYIGDDEFTYRALTENGWVTTPVCLLYKDFVNKNTAWRKKIGSEYCVTHLGFRTGYQGWEILEEFNIIDGTLTGNEKRNTIGDSDYVSPEKNETACVPQNIFWNFELKQTFSRECDEDSLGSPVEYVVPANKYYGATQDAADDQAEAEMLEKGQQNANEKGTCTEVVFWNDPQSKVFKKQCDFGQVGETFTYKIAAHLFSDTTKIGANAKAIAALNAGGQAYANEQPGGCLTEYVGNDPQSRPFIKNCGPEFQGSEFIYTVPANVHIAATKAAANHKALQDVLDYGQAWADVQPGGCTRILFWNERQSAIFTRECEDPFLGTTVEYTVYPHTFSAPSLAEANEKALVELALKGQLNANTYGKCVSSLFWNEAQTGTFYKEGCGEDYLPSETVITVDAGQYSGETLEEANQQALDWIAAHGQAIANEEGGCLQVVFWNEELSVEVQRNDCTSGYTGTFVTYTVPYHTYSAATQELADAEAQAEVDAEAQDWANDPVNGSICVPPGSFGNVEYEGFFSKGNCETGFPTVFRYSFAANQIFQPTQEEADELAYAQFLIDGQAFADTDPRGICHPTISGTQPCGELYYFNGGFPATIVYVTINTAPGYITIPYNMLDVPDRLILKIDGVVVADTGYRGDSGYQAALDAALIALGRPTETIAGPSEGSISFYKGTTGNVMEMLMYMPIAGSESFATPSCVTPPVGSTERCGVFYSEDCPEGFNPVAYNYCLPAGAYTGIDLAAANALRDAAFMALGQAEANEEGDCNPDVGNEEQCDTFYSEDCPEGFTAEPFEYCIPANTYFEPTLAEANAVAIGLLPSLGQAAANSGGGCIIGNDARCEDFFSEDCPEGYTAEPYEFCVAADLFFAESKIAANALRDEDFDLLGQAAADTLGDCTPPPPPMYYIVNGCENWNACYETSAEACDEPLPHEEGPCLYSDVREDGIILIGDTLYFDDAENPGEKIPFGCTEGWYLSYNELGGTKIWVQLSSTGVVLSKGTCSTACDLYVSYVNKTDETSEGADDGTITFAFVGDDSEGLLYSIDGGVSFASLTGYTSPYTVTGLPSGSYSISLMKGDGSCETAAFGVTLAQETGTPPGPPTPPVGLINNKITLVITRVNSRRATAELFAEHVLTSNVTVSYNVNGIWLFPGTSPNHSRSSVFLSGTNYLTFDISDAYITSGAGKGVNRGVHGNITSLSPVSDATHNYYF